MRKKNDNVFYLYGKNKQRRCFISLKYNQYDT